VTSSDKLVAVQTDECRWFALEEMKAALYETHSLLGPEPLELATTVTNLKGLTFVYMTFQSFFSVRNLAVIAVAYFIF